MIAVAAIGVGVGALVGSASGVVVFLLVLLSGYLFYVGARLGGLARRVVMGSAGFLAVLALLGAALAPSDTSDPGDRALPDPEQQSQGTSSAEPPTARTGQVRHEGRVTLADGGEYIDLNAPASDQRWNAADSGSFTPDRMNYYIGHLFLPEVQVLRLADEAASWHICSSRTGYAKVGSIGVDTLAGGEDVCLRTASGRYAKLTLLESSEQEVILLITTWER